MAREFELLETLFDFAPVGLGVVDLSLRYVKVNRHLAEINGLPEADHLGRTVAEVLPGLWSAVQPLYQRALNGDTVMNQVVSGSIRADGGETVHRLVRYYPVRRDGRISGVGIVVSDVTEFRRVQDALRLRTDLYAMLARTNQAANEHRVATELFQEVCHIAIATGRFRFAWIGVPEVGTVRVVASAGDDMGYLDQVRIALHEGDPLSLGPTGRAALTATSHVVNDFMRSNATAPWHEAAARAGFMAAAAFPLREGERVAAVLTLYSEHVGFFTPELVTTLNEMTPSVASALDRMARERDQQRDSAEMRLRDRAILAVSQGICITDARLPDNPIIFASPGFARVTGYGLDEVIGRNCRFLQGPDTSAEAVATVRRAVAAGQGCSVELLNYRKDGSPFWNELTISPVVDEHGVLTHLVGVQADVTERRLLERQMRQAQQMEAVGQLSSGVAHDFNNLLTVINGCSDLLLSELDAADERRELATEIRSAGERAGTLTRQLLSFSRKQVVESKLLDLNTVVADSEKLLRRLIGEHLFLETQLRSPLSWVRADPGQMEQVLVNLAVNARDAMPTGGTMRITTGMVTIADRRGSLRAGDYVTLEVSDTGSGMDDATKSRIFEPFFTTKAPGKGTGLGLATVFGIVEQARGHIEVESAVDFGTTFRVYLPAEAAAEDAVATRARSVEIPSGTETIMIVEDEPALRVLARRILERCGYVVIDASDGQDALILAETYRGTIDMVISDVVMPHLGGRQLAQALSALRPSARMLFVSGYTDDDVILHGVVQDEVAFLQKPYTPSTLSQKVRSVLDDGR